MGWYQQYKFKIFLICFLLFLVPAVVFGQDSIDKHILGSIGEEGFLQTAESAGFKTGTSYGPALLIGEYLYYALSFLGVVFLTLIIYGGFIWMLARGDSDAVKKAKDIIINASIGVVVILAGYAVSSYIISSLASSV